MKLYKVAVATSVALIATGVAGAQAADTTNAQAVRESDFITALGDKRSGGSYDFLEEGLRVTTKSNTSQDKVAEYWAATGGLPANGAYDWYGTTNQPGAQIVFDADGPADGGPADGSTDTSGDGYNILVGEQVYSANNPGEPLTDWWLTNGSSQTAKDAAPSTTGGSGSGWHGSLQDWQSALPDATVYAYGFSLGSGIQGDGVLRSQTFGDTTYVFTDEPATTSQDVSGTYTTRLERRPFGANRTYRIDLSSDSQPANTTEGSKLTWRIEVDGVRVADFQQGFSEQETWKGLFPKRSGSHTVDLYRNDVLVDTQNISTRP